MSFATDMRDLSEQIRRAVGTLSPTTNPSQQFVYLDSLTQGEDGEDQTTEPRRFYVEYTTNKRETFGSSRSLRRIEGNVVVGYPAHAKWSISVIADSEQIARAIDSITLTVTNVQFVEALDETEPTETLVGGDFRWARTRFYTEIFVTE